MTITMQDAIKQSAQINELFIKVIKRETTSRYAGDRISAQLRADFIFQTEETSPGQMTFNVAEDFDFFAERLFLYIEARRINLADSNENDVVFLPVNWIAQGELHRPTSNASISFSISDSVHGNMQSVPTSILFAFPTRLDVGFPGGLQFETPVELIKGSTLTINVTPTYSFNFQEDETIREFRVAGVLDGWKAVRR